MNGRFSTWRRFSRLVLLALVVCAPVVQPEARRDRSALVQGGRGGDEQAPVIAFTPQQRCASPRACDETLRVAPRALPVARFLLHRALLI